MPAACRRAFGAHEVPENVLAVRLSIIDLAEAGAFDRAEAFVEKLERLIIDEGRRLRRSLALHDFVERLHATVPPDIHPAGLATIRGWFCEMRVAVDAADAREVARLTRLVEDKVALELQWQAENEATTRGTR
jgi:hypothetical protein